MGRGRRRERASWRHSGASVIYDSIRNQIHTDLENRKDSLDTERPQVPGLASSAQINRSSSPSVSARVLMVDSNSPRKKNATKPDNDTKTMQLSNCRGYC